MHLNYATSTVLFHSIINSISSLIVIANQRLLNWSIMHSNRNINSLQITTPENLWRPENIHLPFIHVKVITCISHGPPCNFANMFSIDVAFVCFFAQPFFCKISIRYRCVQTKFSSILVTLDCSDDTIKIEFAIPSFHRAEWDHSFSWLISALSERVENFSLDFLF